MNNGTHCKHGIHYSDGCQKCMPIYTEEELQEEIKEAKKSMVPSTVLSVLEQVEFLHTPQWIDGKRDCPICRETEPRHKDDCELALAIKTLHESSTEKLDPLKNALYHFLSFGRPREGSDRYHQAWDKMKEAFEGMK